MGLYSQEVVLMFRYFLNNRDDPILLRAMMGVLLANDTFSTLAEIYCVWTYCITNW